MKLRHKVTIKRRAGSGTNAQGGSQKEWAVLWSNVPAAIKLIRGDESEIGHQTISEETVEITMLYLLGVTERCRIYYYDRVYEVNNVETVDEIRRVMVATCTRIKQDPVAVSNSGFSSGFSSGFGLSPPSGFSSGFSWGFG